MKTTVGQYLLDSIKSFNIKHIFGVPGDYNLLFLDQIIADAGLTWMGDTNELNAGYAADAYANIHGISALLVTGGVGELSALNALGGAYVEYAPIIQMVGHPSLPAQADKKLIHHMLDEMVVDKYLEIAKHVTVSQAVITRDNAAYEIPRVLQEIYRKKRPGYIAIPSGENDKIIEAEPFKPSYPSSDSAKLKQAVSHILEKLKTSSNPVALIDIFVKRFGLAKEVQKFIEKQQLTFAHTLMGRGAVSELIDNYLGIYMGKIDISTHSHTRSQVENADLLLCLGGYYQADYNTGFFSQDFSKIKTVIEILPNTVKVMDTIYTDVWIHDVIRALNEEKQLHVRTQHLPSVFSTKTEEKVEKPKQGISQSRFWERMKQWVPEGSIIVSEVGTAIWAATDIPLKNNVEWVGSKLWASIGYATGAALGASIADSKRRVIAFIGDGSFQVTAQAVSSMLFHRQNPIIFLLNNDGYTIERVIHGETARYNDIPMWDYTSFAKSLTKDPSRIWTATVNSEDELEKALTSIPKDKLVFIEVLMDRMDYPVVMNRVFREKPRVSLYQG